MATKQQVLMLLGRAGEAGVKADWTDFAELNNGQIDQKLDEFESLKKGREHTTDFGKMRQEQGLNSMRFGMCCKLVAKHKTIGWCIAERQKFASEVLSLYNSVTYAEKVVADKAVRAEDVTVVND